MPDSHGLPDGLTLDVSEELNAWQSALGEDSERWAARIIRAVAGAHPARGDLSILLTDDASMRALNAQWRGKDTSTNVLSFPAAAGFGALGDIALGLETVRNEADAAGKAFAAHAAHLLVHGYLHLLGYDHETESEAMRMEAAERAVLRTLNIADPYQVAEAH